MTGSELWLRSRDTSSIDWPSRTGTRRDQPRRSSERGGKFGFDVVQILEPPTVVGRFARLHPLLTKGIAGSRSSLQPLDEGLQAAPDRPQDSAAVL